MVVALFSGLETLGTTMQVNNCASLDFDYFKAGKVTTATLDKNTATYVALKQLQKDGLNFSEGATFTKKQMHDAVEKVFGKDYNYIDGNIVNCPSITYDASSETYKVGPAGCGGSCGAVSVKKLVKAVQIGETIELEIRVIFADSNGNYYSDYSKTNKIQVKYETGGIISSSSVDMGTLYKVIFKKENENYIFVSSDISR